MIEDYMKRDQILSVESFNMKKQLIRKCYLIDLKVDFIVCVIYFFKIVYISIYNVK